MRGTKRQSEGKNSMSEEIHFEKSSGNVFRDLGVKNPDLHFLKLNLGLKIIHLIRDRHLTQTRAAAIMCISQPELSRL
jgi:predicted XRE-type DNA-binding protein